jgi:outer membrane protein
MIARRSVLLALSAFLVGSTPALVAQTTPGGAFDLEAALGYALDHSFAIRQARARIREREGVTTTIAAAGLPTISAAASFQRSSTQTVGTQGVGPVFLLPSGKYWRMTVTARQALYAGGGISAANRAARLTEEASVAALKETAAQVLLDVRLKFYNVLLAKEEIGVAEQNIEVLRRQLADATNRYEVGSVSRFEQVRAEVAVANAQPALITARNNHRLAIEELRQAIGLAADDPAANSFSVEGSLHVEPYSIDLASALAAARKNRPELDRLAKLKAAAENNETVARSEYSPRLAATAGGELRKGPTDNFGDSRRGLRAGVEGQWSVASKATAGRVIQAESLAAQSLLTLQEAGLTIDVEVRRASASLDQASELVSATKKTGEQAEEALRVAEVRRGAGSATQLEVLQAQTALTTARTNQLRAVHGYNAAAAQLRRAIGVSEVAVAASEPPRTGP